MQKVFSSYVTSQTMLVRDALVRNGVEVTIQNENQGLSPIPAFQPSAEVWVMRDDDYEQARQIVAATMATMTSKPDLPSWTCPDCREVNPPAFEVCWNCGTARATGNDPA